MGKMPVPRAMPRAVSPSLPRAFLLDDFDFVVGQAVELISQLINLAVGRPDPPLEDRRAPGAVRGP